MDIKDRGIKKWQGFFMPEHIKDLNVMWQDDHKIKMPILDEYQIQELENVVDYSMEYKRPVEFTLVTHGIQHQIKGFVHFIDNIKKQFHLKEMNNNVEYIKFDEIIDVKVIE